MGSKFEKAYYLNLSDDEPDEDLETDEDSGKSDKYPKIEYDRIDEIDAWDTRKRKKVKKLKDGKSGDEMSVEKCLEHDTLFGKRMLLRIKSSIVVDVSKFGDEYYVYRVADSIVGAKRGNVELNDVVKGDSLGKALVAKKYRPERRKESRSFYCRLR